ncbi:hypothetical protein CO230_04490 [Chryseobacterium sp. 6424]|uniref:DUF4349 domain-containing protein n=1 Tax=Chryseobacterium sp. 6424 TaxID=2039166 RepID=UPI000EFAF80C|nr:DUF4349 domain-containing protein [Chryseobacterium sp. 6424]AYO57446.1 hypothetical protein CO230_04490 [Chryseobacterium sp. 6424]
MKNFLAPLLSAMLLLSCDKSTVQQTTDNIKKADSLFTKANNGIKTLDSISKTITDTEGITKKVILPEIEKQKKTIDSTVKSSGWGLDSINKKIEKITRNVVVGTEVAKTLDSANNALSKGENALKVLSGAADKILNQTKKQTEATSPNAETDPTENTTPTVTATRDPLVKTARLEIAVDDLSASKTLLRQKIRENNAELVDENFSQNEGIKREYYTARVPLSYFDQLVNDLSGNLGDIQSKSMASEGRDYDASQICEVEVTLLQQDNFAQNPDESEGEATGAKGAFLKGLDYLEKTFIFLLPFWPLFLIGATVWYFISRNKKKKAREMHEQQTPQLQTEEYPTENQTSTEPLGDQQNHTTPDSDYSKYLPKK